MSDPTDRLSAGIADELNDLQRNALNLHPHAELCRRVEDALEGE
jgi:hypothetical protein